MPFKITAPSSAALSSADINWHHVAPKDRASGELSFKGRTFRLQRVDTGQGSPRYEATLQARKGVLDRLPFKQGRLEKDAGRLFTRAVRLAEHTRYRPFAADVRLNQNVAYDFQGRPLAADATDQDKQNAIVCRHLAGGWALGRFLAPRESDGAPKHTYQGLAPGAVLDLVADEQTVSFLESRDSTVVDSARLGKTLKREFESMQPGETRRLVLHSANHAMACELKRKPAQASDGAGGHGSDVYVLNFFDPNLTTTHLRWKADDLKELEALSFEELTIEPAVARAYLDGTPLLTLSRVSAKDVATAQAAKDAGDTRVLALDRPPQPRLDSESRFALQDAMRRRTSRETVLIKLANANRGQDLADLSDIVRELPEPERFEALNPKVIGAAVLADNTDAIRGISTLLSRTGLSSQTKRRCVLPADTFATLARDIQPSTVDAYLDALAKNLSGRDLHAALNFDRGRVGAPAPAAQEAIARCIVHLSSPALRLSNAERTALLAKYEAFLAEARSAG